MSIVERARKRLDIAKPWGSERVLTPSDTPYEAKMLFIEAGQRLSLQFHPNKTETLVLVDGDARLLLRSNMGEDTEIPMQRLVGYTVSQGRVHRLASTDGAALVECASPGGVTVRLEDDYGRAS